MNLFSSRSSDLQSPTFSVRSGEVVRLAVGGLPCTCTLALYAVSGEPAEMNVGSGCAQGPLSSGGFVMQAPVTACGQPVVLTCNNSVMFFAMPGSYRLVLSDPACLGSFFVTADIEEAKNLDGIPASMILGDCANTPVTCGAISAVFQDTGLTAAPGVTKLLGQGCQMYMIPGETPLVITSPDGSVSITQSGVNGHTVQLSTQPICTQLAARPIGADAVFGATRFLGDDCEYHLLPAIPPGAVETPLVVTSPDGSVTIVQSGTNGHTLQLTVAAAGAETPNTIDTNTAGMAVSVSGVAGRDIVVDYDLCAGIADAFAAAPTVADTTTRLMGANCQVYTLPPGGAVVESSAVLSTSTPGMTVSNAAPNGHTMTVDYDLCAGLNGVKTVQAAPDCPPTSYLKLDAGGCPVEVPFNAPTTQPVVQTAAQAAQLLTGAAIAAACPGGAPQPDVITPSVVFHESVGNAQKTDQGPVYWPRTTPGIPVTAGQVLVVFSNSNRLGEGPAEVLITSTLTPSGVPTTLLASGGQGMNDNGGAQPLGYDLGKYYVFRAEAAGNLVLNYSRDVEQGFGQLDWTVVKLTTANGSIPQLITAEQYPNGKVTNDGSPPQSQTLGAGCGALTLWSHLSYAGTLAETGATLLQSDQFQAAPFTPPFVLAHNVLSDTDCTIGYSVTGNGNASTNTSDLNALRQSILGVTFDATFTPGAANCTIAGPSVSADVTNPNVCPGGSGASLTPSWSWAGAEVQYNVPAGSRYTFTYVVGGTTLTRDVDNSTGVVDMQGTWSPTAQGVLAAIAAGATSTAVAATFSTEINGAATPSNATNRVVANIGSIQLRTAA